MKLKIPTCGLDEPYPPIVVHETSVQKTTKPPIGLKPRWIVDSERLGEVSRAIARYYASGDRIPVEWIEEYNDLIGRIKKEDNV